jgi:hypothetical protein
MITVLFARADSIYKSFPLCDVYDEARDALSWTGGTVVIAHPPCRAWGRLRRFAKYPPDEATLALWAVAQVQRHGGILEHPAASALWAVAGLPRPNAMAPQEKGFSLCIPQWWFGHRAEKLTWLYMYGCTIRDIPAIPFRLGEPSRVISASRIAHGRGSRPEVTHAEREHTPPLLAQWLVDVAMIIQKKKEQCDAITT